jgi:hypothetical protein
MTPKYSYCVFYDDTFEQSKAVIDANIKFVEMAGLNYELVILNYNYKKNADEFIKKHYAKAIECGKVNYYQNERPPRFQTSHPLNLLCKAALGEIIIINTCHVPLNMHFISKLIKTKSDSILISTKITETTEKLQVIGKQVFDKMRGFDESLMKDGIATSYNDFIRRCFVSDVNFNIISFEKIFTISPINDSNMQNKILFNQINNYITNKKCQVNAEGFGRSSLLQNFSKTLLIH